MPGRFWAEGFASVAWWASRRIFAPAKADARKQGGIPILKTNLDSDSSQSRKQFFFQIERVVTLESISRRRKSRIRVAARTDRLLHSKVNRKNRAGPQLNDPVGRRTKHRSIQ